MNIPHAAPGTFATQDMLFHQLFRIVLEAVGTESRMPPVVGATRPW
jgi:hypothetical protein